MGLTWLVLYLPVNNGKLSDFSLRTNLTVLLRGALGLFSKLFKHGKFVIVSVIHLFVAVRYRNIRENSLYGRE